MLATVTGIRLTELPFLIGGVPGRLVRAALSPLPASRRPAVLLPSGYPERLHARAVSRWDHSGSCGNEITMGCRTESSAQNKRGNRTLADRCYKASDPPLSSVFKVRGNIQTSQRWLRAQRPIAHVNNNNNNCSTGVWTEEHRLLSYFRTQLKGLKTHTPTHTLTHTRPNQTQLNNTR